jgi:hypothetical protein
MEHARVQSLDLLGVRITFVAFALLAMLAFASTPAIAADESTRADRTELRIRDMHAKLKITAVQEAQWTKVADVMRDNAKIMDTLTQARKERATGMTAVDDLNSYGEIATAHADGIRKLSPVFADLYAGMSDTQKVEADTLFRHGPRKHGHKRSAPKAPAAQ